MIVKRWIIVLEISFLVLLCCCGKEETEETVKNLQEAVFVFEGNIPVTAYALDEEKNLYTAGVWLEGDYDCYYLCQYDTERNLQYQYKFDHSINRLTSIAVKGQTIYFSANGKSEQTAALYSFHKDTEEIKILAEYPFFQSIDQMILQDKRLYLLSEQGRSRLIYYSFDEEESYEMQIDDPISMAFSDLGKLMIYAGSNENGYRILEYDPETDSATTAAQLNAPIEHGFAVCGSGKELIYSYGSNTRGLVLSSLDNMDFETELCPKALLAGTYNTKVLYQDEEVYLLNKDNNVMQFSLSDIRHKSKAIRYISPGYQVDAPYGCGYEMLRKEMDAQKFVLKVLSQDPDYDLCLIDSLDSSSYNLKKNGAFYPLNDVPGVEEYLDKCFPYIKDAATKEDGTIWMLPIAVYMPGLIVQEASLKEFGVPLERNMTWEEFGSVISGMTKEQQRRKNLSQQVCVMLFFQQYFKHYTSIDNELFRQNAAALQQFSSDMLLSGYQEDRKYLFYYARYESEYTNSFLKEKYYGLDAKVYSMPKLTAEDVNTGTCIFLAVNPASDRLKETLDFIKSWTAWQMAEETAPLHFKTFVPEEGTFEAEVYNLYQNGEIAFAIDTDAYLDGFYEMLDRKKDLEEYIRSTEKRLKIYFGE